MQEQDDKEGHIELTCSVTIPSVNNSKETWTTKDMPSREAFAADENTVFLL